MLIWPSLFAFGIRAFFSGCAIYANTKYCFTLHIRLPLYVYIGPKTDECILIPVNVSELFWMSGKQRRSGSALYACV